MSNSRRAERVFNVLVGLSVLSWAALGVGFAGASARFSAVRVSVALLNLLVGSLFLIRKPLVKQGSVASAALSLPSLLVCGLSFKLSPPADEWPIHAEGIFVAGTILAMVSLANLGRSFAVFPAVREVVCKGPYRVTRHPAYAGELLLVLGCFLAKPGLFPAWALGAALPSVVVRILIEERLLMREAAYQAYAAKVRWRLLPGLW